VVRGMVGVLAGSGPGSPLLKTTAGNSKKGQTCARSRAVIIMRIDAFYTINKINNK